MQKVTPFLMFPEGGKDAVETYARIFKDAAVHNLVTTPDGVQLLQANFSLGGQEFMAMDGGDSFRFEEGTSFYVNCKDQTEVDYYWGAFMDAGGTPSQCGWLKDKWGVSWQIIPEVLGELIGGPDQEKSQRAMAAMLKMQKLDIAMLQQAYDGE